LAWFELLALARAVEIARKADEPEPGPPHPPGPPPGPPNPPRPPAPASPGPSAHGRTTGSCSWSTSGRPPALRWP
jgi:hypothetical protein